MVQTAPGDLEKVLIVVDRFPTSGGSRVDKFVKFLPEAGFEPIVLSARETVSNQSQELRRTLYPPALKTYHAGSLGWSYFTERFLDRSTDAKDYKLLQLLSLPERLVYLPDYMVRWIPLGIRLARQIVVRERVRVVFTSSPPESVHLVGLALKRKLGVRWVADFRDLWTERSLLYRPPTRAHDWWIRRLERRIFETADHIVANTPENSRRYLQRFGLTRYGVSTIPNGFDPDDVLPNTRNAPSGVFWICYTGNLDKHNYPWQVFLDALRMLADKVGHGRVRFVHCGFYSRRVAQYMRDKGIAELVVSHGMLSHIDAMQLAARADLRLVLLLESEYSSAIVPMKLYNYLVMNGPILAIAPEQGEAAQIISKTRKGAVVSSSRGAQGVYGVLDKLYRAWEKGVGLDEPNTKEIQAYNRRLQTFKLARVFEGLLTKQPSPCNRTSNEFD